ncbi:isochorismatase family protein [Mesorhizobium sp. CCNWLW179-1]|uniref:isochorismatase family protein n=1 Tax=unclassified Mesorhizobium TaxID=325217 RepID=UPI003014A377
MAVAIIDLQERLVPAIGNGEDMVAAARKLAAGARILGQQVCFTEQNPDKLGGTVNGFELGSELPISKLAFDSSRLLPEEPEEWILAGCEAHICIRQTAHGLLEAGKRVIIAVDAVGSRKPIDKETALRQLQRAGAELSTVEAILFKWLGGADHPEFRQVSKLIK